MFTETWLSNKIETSELDLTNFSIFRCDRLHLTNPEASEDVGVLIGVCSTFSVREIPNLDTSLEQVWVSLFLDNETLLLGCIYIPPSSHSSIYERFGNSLLKLREQFPTSDISVSGDLNLPNLIWSNNRFSASFNFNDLTYTTIKNKILQLAPYVNFLNLFQSNFIFNNYGSTLDMIFSMISGVHTDRAVDELSRVEDYHPPLHSIILTNPAIRSIPSYTYYNFHKANYDLISDHLNNFDWHELLNSNDIDTNLDIFYKIIHETIEQFVPKYKIKPTLYPP